MTPVLFYPAPKSVYPSPDFPSPYRCQIGTHPIQYSTVRACFGSLPSEANHVPKLFGRAGRIWVLNSICSHPDDLGLVAQFPVKAGPFAV